MLFNWKKKPTSLKYRFKTGESRKSWKASGRILFVDFSSAFNTIMPDLLSDKLAQLSVPLHLSVDHQLPDRQAAASEAEQTHIQNSHHQHWRPSGLCSLPTALLPLHKWLHFKGPSIKLLKFADGTTVIGLIKDGDESAYRQEVEQLAVWCSLNNLELNTLKTVEMIVDFRRNPPALPHNHHLSGPEVGQSHWWKRTGRGCISSAS